MPRGRKKSRNGLISVETNGVYSDATNVSVNTRTNRAVNQRIMSPVGRGMSEDSSPSPTTPPKLKKMPDTSSTLDADATSSRVRNLKAASAKITDYFSQSTEMSALSNTDQFTNGDLLVQSKKHEYAYSVSKILNGDMKPMLYDKVLPPSVDSNLDEDAESDIIYATQEELEEDSCSRDSSSFGCSGEDSGPGKENEDWSGKSLTHPLLRSSQENIENSHLTRHSSGIEGGQINGSIQNYQNTNFMIKNIGAISKEKQNVNSMYNYKDLEASKAKFDQEPASIACNRNSNGNQNSPLQPRRVMTRSHTAKNNNISMSDKKYESNGMNNNSSSNSSPSKSKVTSSKMEVQKKIQLSKNVTPTKKSVTSSILSFTSSILAAAASASKEELASSPEQSPSRERRRVIDLSSSNSSPLKRSSTPSASPTRRGGRAIKPSQHQGTPPQSPPTPHKIICQATVETIEPSGEATSDIIHDKELEPNSLERIRSSPSKKFSPGTKLISSLSPKKIDSNVDKKAPTVQDKEANAVKNNLDSETNQTITDDDKVSCLPARRNLTNSFLSSTTSEPIGQSNDNTLAKPKNRVGNGGTRASSNDDVVSENKKAPLRSNRNNISSSSRSKSVSSSTTNTKVTDFFPIRRSERKPKTELASKQWSEIIERLTVHDEKCQSGNSKENKDLDANLGIGIKWYEGKGRGIEARKRFSKGDFVVEYAGDLIEGTAAAKTRENKYAKDSSKGCYMYYFKHGDKNYCIDATAESGRLGRLVNHSRVNPNMQTKVVIVKDTPRLLLVAKKDIEPGTELLYDYGDRSKESLLCHPWLAL